MSELKTFDIVVAEEGYCEGIVKYRRAVYDKYEADKVIAEKDTEIVELKKSLEQKNIAEGSVRRILWELMDGGIIKEWYFNGEYNVLLSADDPHIQIAELKTKIEEVSLKFCKQLRHQKYKRCLAMAKLCRSCWAANIFIHEGPDRISMHYMKWEKRWLELAAIFKEAK